MSEKEVRHSLAIAYQVANQPQGLLNQHIILKGFLHDAIDCLKQLEAWVLNDEGCVIL